MTLLYELEHQVSLYKGTIKRTPGGLVITIGSASAFIPLLTLRTYFLKTNLASSEEFAREIVEGLLEWDMKNLIKGGE